MSKVPAALHGTVLATEQVAVYLYLADLFPDAGLAPTPTDPDRDAYLARDGFPRRLLRARRGGPGDESGTPGRR